MAVLANLAYQPIAFDVPDGDRAAKSVNTGSLVWTQAAIYTLDPTQNNQMLDVKNIQSVFIDNYETTGTTVLQVLTTGHKIRIPPKSQAFLPLIAGDRPVIEITNSSGNGRSQAWLLNIPALGVVWTLP